MPGLTAERQLLTSSSLQHNVLMLKHLPILNSYNRVYTTTTRVRRLKLCINRHRFWRATHDWVAPYIDIILHTGQFWAKSATSGSVRWWCFRSCWTVLSHVMRGRPSCLLQSAGGEDNRILLASALSSVRKICPNTVSRRDWIIAVSLCCFVSLRTSSFRTNWYHLMPNSIRRHHWSSASI